MTIQARPPDPGDDDGVRIVRTGRAPRVAWLIAAAVLLPILVTLGAVLAIRRLPGTEAGAAPRPVSAPVAVADAGPAAASVTGAPGPKRTPAHVVPRRIVAAPVEDPAGLGASPVPQPEKPRREIDAGDAILALREEGVHEGIAAFGLPGSHPPKAGILVPEEFALPEGFVRHYQSTDDGEQLPAILMFHPDYEFLNEQGQVVKIPENLVVPPELAPPGLATDRVLEVPARKVGEPVH